MQMGDARTRARDSAHPRSQDVHHTAHKTNNIAGITPPNVACEALEFAHNRMQVL